MYLLDTNHLTILQRGGESSLRLASRLSQIDSAQIFTTIISYHEQTQGLDERGKPPFQCSKA
jgi:tRNA(fMet)-specific endonuclease VapC